jgi:hypothetical protein
MHDRDTVGLALLALEEGMTLAGAAEVAGVPLMCLVKSHLRKRARPSFGFQHASFSVSGAGTPLAS